MRAKKSKRMTSTVTAAGSSMEYPADEYGYGARQHQDVVPSCGQGPQGTCAAMVPFGSAPPVPAPPVGAGKGFKGW